MTKTELRKQILKLRDAQDTALKTRRDGLISERAIEYVMDNHVGTVLTYVSYRSEVDTYGILEGCLGRGIRVAVPRIENRRMKFYYVRSIEELKKGYMGIYEPIGSTREWQPSEHTLAIVPGTVFDRGGNRIGYGGGNYDRFLSANPGLPSMGFAYELQMVDEVPVEEWDVALDMIVTENELIHTKNT